MKSTLASFPSHKANGIGYDCAATRNYDAQNRTVSIPYDAITMASHDYDGPDQHATVTACGSISTVFCRATSDLFFADTTHEAPVRFAGNPTNRLDPSGLFETGYTVHSVVLQAELTFGVGAQINFIFFWDDYGNNVVGLQFSARAGANIGVGGGYANAKGLIEEAVGPDSDGYDVGATVDGVGPSVSFDKNFRYAGTGGTVGGAPERLDVLNFIKIGKLNVGVSGGYDLPIMVLSADLSHTTTRECRNRGLSAFLRDMLVPLNPEQIQGMIDSQNAREYEKLKEQMPDGKDVPQQTLNEINHQDEDPGDPSLYGG